MDIAPLSRLVQNPISHLNSFPAGASSSGRSFIIQSERRIYAASLCFFAAIVYTKRSQSGRSQMKAKGGWPQRFIVSGDAKEAVAKVEWPAECPYTSQDFRRQDERDDTFFYSQPRLCTHVDDGFIATLRGYYEKVFKEYSNARILDICSSWISHYPDKQGLWSHVSITGMNEFELSKNAQADDYKVQNLNLNTVLDYPDESFDIVTCAVSFDYLNKPLEVMQEVARVLKPGGSVILSTSNRCFPDKVVAIWLQTDDLGHVLIYSSYMHYTGSFDVEAQDLSSPWSRIGFGDPVYVIRGKKKVMNV